MKRSVFCAEYTAFVQILVVVYIAIVGALVGSHKAIGFICREIRANSSPVVYAEDVFVPDPCIRYEENLVVIKVLGFLVRHRQNCSICILAHSALMNIPLRLKFQQIVFDHQVLYR